MDITKLCNIMFLNSNFSFILNDNSIFSTTEYKVLSNQKDSCFIKCFKMILNGKIQLLYLSEKYIPLKNVLSSLEEGQLLFIIGDLINKILAIKNNGFLSCQNINISIENIYIEPATNHCKLVYLPLNEKLFPNQYSFESFFVTVLTEIIQSTSCLSFQKINDINNMIIEESYSIENIALKLYNFNSSNSNLNEKVNSNKRLVLVATNSPSAFSLNVDKSSYIIGRKKSSVDGYIGFNKMIGRIHCKIENRNNDFFIFDLNSSNGTYLNQEKLIPEQPYKIKNGDIVRLANSDFKVNIK